MILSTCSNTVSGIVRLGDGLITTPLRHSGHSMSGIANRFIKVPNLDGPLGRRNGIANKQVKSRRRVERRLSRKAGVIPTRAPMSPLHVNKGFRAGGIQPVFSFQRSPAVPIELPDSLAASSHVAK
jgi:hypothetical protein